MAFSYFTAGTTFNFMLLEGEFFKLVSNNVDETITIAKSDNTTETIRIDGANVIRTIGGYVGNSLVTVVVGTGLGRFGIDYDGLDIPLSASRSTNIGDDKKILSNRTTSNYTITIERNTFSYGCIIQQLSTGTVTVAAGSGVTFIGATLATTTAGQKISIVPTDLPNTFNVSVA